MLPAPDVVLNERITLYENTYENQSTSDPGPTAEAGVCDVLRLAARKAVGCGDDAAFQGVWCKQRIHILTHGMVER